MSASLVGSEMCIRDRCRAPGAPHFAQRTRRPELQLKWSPNSDNSGRGTRTVSYTHLTLPTICSV
eukprot:688286-Alexandrium_andersonii.AAC.1